MNKKITCILTLLALSGCQTATELQKSSAGGFNTMASCEQIHTTFGAYDRDRQSIEALRQIAGMTNTSIQGVTPATVDSYYPLVRDTANIALMVKGCSLL